MAPSPRDKNCNEDINKTSCGCSCAYSHRVTRTVRTWLAEVSFVKKDITQRYPDDSIFQNDRTKLLQTLSLLSFCNYLRNVLSPSNNPKRKNKGLIAPVVGLFSRGETRGSSEPQGRPWVLFRVCLRMRAAANERLLTENVCTCAVAAVRSHISNLSIRYIDFRSLITDVKISNLSTF